MAAQPVASSGHAVGVMFGPLVPAGARAGLAGALAPWIDAGFRVEVDVPELFPSLGWSVSASRLSRHAMFRLETNGSPTTWALVATAILRSEASRG